MRTFPQHCVPQGFWKGLGHLLPWFPGPTAPYLPCVGFDLALTQVSGAEHLSSADPSLVLPSDLSSASG